MQGDFRLFRPLVFRVGKKYWQISASAIMLGLFTLGSLAMIACVVLTVVAVFGSMYASGNILPGVSVQGTGVNNVAVVSLSPAAAADRLSSTAIDRPITLRDGDRTWQISSAALGV